MEVIVALGVPEGTPLLTTEFLVYLSSTSAISFRLEAVCTIIGESRVVMWAVLPADGANTVEALFAGWVALGSIFFHAVGAGGEGLAGCPPGCLLPARVGHICVVVIMMEVVDGLTVIVLFSVSEGLLRVAGEVRYVLLVLIVRVVAFVGHRVVVLAVKAPIMVRAVIEIVINRIVVFAVVNIARVNMLVVMGFASDWVSSDWQFFLVTNWIFETSSMMAGIGHAEVVSCLMMRCLMMRVNVLSLMRALMVNLMRVLVVSLMRVYVVS